MLEVEPLPKEDMIEVSSSLQKTQIQTDHIILIIVVQQNFITLLQLV